MKSEESIGLKTTELEKSPNQKTPALIAIAIYGTATYLKEVIVLVKLESSFQNIYNGPNFVHIGRLYIGRTLLHSTILN